jgi:hypothetical protein
MKTAMQDLREDLQETINTARDSLLEIKNEGIRKACQEVVQLTLKNVIERIDEELLEMEKEQIENAFSDGVDDEYEYHINSEPRKNSEQYYKEKFKNKKNGNNNN